MLALASPAAAAPAPAAGGHGGISVVQVQGYIDPPTVALLRRALGDADRTHASLLLVQLNSTGALATDVDALVSAVRSSAVPVAVWVGPSGAHAAGAAALLAQAAPVLFVSQGSDIGPATPVRLDQPGAVSSSRARQMLTALGGDHARAGAGALATRQLGATAAAASRATDGVRPTLGEVIVTLDGRVVNTAREPVRLSTAKVVGTGRGRRREPNQQVVFTSLGLGAKVQHALINPRLAYLLLVAGLALIVFEFFAASVGFAAVVGAAGVLGAAYGFSHLPVRWWALALLALAVLAFSIDVQAGGVGTWTAIGTVSLLVGSLALYGGSSRLHVPWWETALVSAGVLLFFVGAVPAFVRSRFSTPTIGREGLVGEVGEAEVAVDPDGLVVIRGSRWRARTNRATPIEAGARVQVVAVEGLVLEVEPEAGGARDYRDRARRRGASRSEGPDG